MYPTLIHRRFAYAISVTIACLLLAAFSALGQSYTWKNVQILGGGFISGIVFNQTQPGLVYVRTDIGGAYRQDPATKRWIPLTDWISADDWNLTGIASLATDPVNPNIVYLAAGTYTIDWTSQNGAILKSTDQGATWSGVFLPFKLGGNMPGRGCGERLVIDPNKNNILYLAAPSGNGLWKSVDSGATWSKVNSFPNPGTYIEDPTFPYTGDVQGLFWVAFDKRTGTPGNATQTLYVGVADKTGPSIYRSTDGGATWAAIPGQPVGFLPHKGVLDPVNGVLYVAYSDNGGPYGGLLGDVWKLNLANGAWTRISPIPSDNPNGDNYFGYSGLSIDRQNPNTVMVTGYSSWWPDTMIWRSVNGGATWSRIWDWTRYPNRSFRYTQDITAAPWLLWPAAPTCSGGGRPGAEVNPKLGWMTEALEIDPFNRDRFFYGTGATLYGSTNLTVWDQSGSSQIGIKVMAQGIEETAVIDLISPPSGAPLISALGDIRGFRHNNLDTPPSAQFSKLSSSTSLDFAELSPSYIVRVGNGDSDNCEKSCAISSDGGTTWTVPTAQPAGITGGGRVAVSATGGGKFIWSPEGIGIQYTANGGKNWAAATGVPYGSTARAYVAADRLNAAKFYAFVDGTFYVSTDTGHTFAARAATGFPLDHVKIKAVPGREGDIWLVGGASWQQYGLWHSTDSGVTFTKLANVPEADNIGFGKAATGQTYPALYISARIGGIYGVYRSIDAGGTWVRINDDTHQFGTLGQTAITGDPRTFGRVYLSTNGRGIIYGDPVP
jgi:xyloglucan-specific exo-beta-1,4-glucanase